MNLLDMLGNGVYETTYTRKLTIDGVTSAYKVYRVDISLLFYNDKNDRIVTWINQYNREHSESLNDLPRERYNRVIEEFVYNSNPVALEKTKNNIELVNQREAGVALADGRVIDGNRRLTCIRMLNRKNADIKYFETVILDLDIVNNYKRIKTLELSIQHGEEQRVDYNPLDKLIGMYNDIVINKVLTIDEYSQFTNETVGDIKKHLVVASLIDEFLTFIHAPYCYHIARELQIVSPLTDLAEFLKRIKDLNKRDELKEIVFSAIFLNATGDFRKYIKDVIAILTSGAETLFINEQGAYKDDLKNRLEDVSFTNINELKTFVKDNVSLSNDMQESVETWTTKSKKKIILSKPIESATKAIAAIETIDTRIVDRLDSEGSEKFKKEMVKIQKVVNKYLDSMDGGSKTEEAVEEKSEPVVQKAQILKPCFDDPVIIVDNSPILYSLIAKIKATIMFKGKKQAYVAYFIKEDDSIVSNQVNIDVDKNEETELLFQLKNLTHEDKYIYLVFKKEGSDEKEISYIYAFRAAITFSFGIGL